MFHDRAPFVARPGQEQGGELLLERTPLARVHLQVEGGIGQLRLLAQQRVELRFDRADRDVLAVGAFIGVIEMRAGIEQVDPALVAPLAVGEESIGHRREHGRTIGHRAIDHLALAGAARREDAGDHAERHEHAAAAEIAHRIDRWGRLLGRAAIAVQRARKRDIVEVMPGIRCIGPGLAPAGHPAVNELRIVGEQHVGAEPQSLHHAGTEALDQAIGGADEVAHLRYALGRLEIGRDHLAVAVENVAIAGVAHGRAAGCAFHPDDPGTVIGQHHRGERAGSDSRQFDDRHPCQCSGHVSPPRLTDRLRRAR